MVERAAYEFADLEKMVDAAERLAGPVPVGALRHIVLPPSFPYGGMENPRLTFATPTVLAGDRSLTSLAAHELAHSWSGNLVTNATWNDFWLNEGFTTYFENRIMESLYGPERAAMLQQVDRTELLDALKELPRADTSLVIDLRGRDPDDGSSSVPYAKGSAFLRMLERALGRPAFDTWLRAYLDHFAFQSITTAQFLDHLRTTLLSKDPGSEDRLRIHAWLYRARATGERAGGAVGCARASEDHATGFAAGTAAAPFARDARVGFSASRSAVIGASAAGSPSMVAYAVPSSTRLTRALTVLPTSFAALATTTARPSSFATAAFGS